MRIKATIKASKSIIASDLFDCCFGGLDLEIPEDPRIFSLMEFGGVKIGKAPVDKFTVPNVPPTKEQFNTDFCVGMETSYTVEQDYVLELSDREDKWIKRLAAAFNFAATKKRYYGGDYSGFGLSIPCALGSAQHDGICLESLWPMLASSNKRNYMANYRNIPDEAWEDAATRKMKKGYFKVDLFRNKYDNFCAGMYHWHEMIITGLYWYQGFYLNEEKKLVMNMRGGKMGHCVSAKGFDIHPKNGKKRMWFADSYFKNPEWWLYEDEVNRYFYNGLRS
jgi:putative methionine-R-sulfoxide reductase with GAF domain